MGRLEGGGGRHRRVEARREWQAKKPAPPGALPLAGAGFNPLADSFCLERVLFAARCVLLCILSIVNLFRERAPVGVGGGLTTGARIYLLRTEKVVPACIPLQSIYGADDPSKNLPRIPYLAKKKSEYHVFRIIQTLS